MRTGGRTSKKQVARIARNRKEKIEERKNEDRIGGRRMRKEMKKIPDRR